MIRFILAGAALLLLIGSSAITSADESITNQDSQPSGFAGTIERLAEARNRISSYDVTIKIRVNNTLKEVAATDGKIYKAQQHPVSATLKMIYDKKQSKFLVVRQDIRDDKETGERLVTRWNIFGRTLNPIEDDNRDFSRGRFIGSLVEFFDPLAMGLHFPAEFRNGNRFDEIIDNYLKWPDDFEKKSLPNGRMRFEKEDRWYIIDTKRGYWPTAMGRHIGDKMLMQTALKLSKCDGHWVPTYASVVLPDDTLVLEFEWHSVNRPIPKVRFTKADFLDRFGVALEDVLK